MFPRFRACSCKRWVLAHAQAQAIMPCSLLGFAFLGPPTRYHGGGGSIARPSPPTVASVVIGADAASRWRIQVVYPYALVQAMVSIYDLDERDSHHDCSICVSLLGPQSF